MWRALLLAGVGVVEVVGVVGRHWWSELFGAMAYAHQLAATFAVCLAVFSGGKIFGVVASAKAAGRFPWPLMACQGVVYLLFVGLTIGLVNGGRASAEAAWWYAVWATVGVMTVGLWMATALPPSVWLRLAGQLRWEIGLAAVLAAVVWAAGLAAQSLWEPLAGLTVQAVRGCLGLVFSDVTADPVCRVVGAGGFRVQVGAACSGYEGFGLVGTVVLSYLALCRKKLRFPAAFGLLPIGIAASWAVNVGRIAALIAVGVWVRPEVAVAGFHTQAGWLCFCAVALGIVALGRFVPAFRRRDEPHPSGDQHPAFRAAPFVVPLMAVVGTGMLTAAFSGGGPDRLYGLRVLVGGLAVWAYRREYARLGWGWSWAPVATGVGAFGVWAGLAQFLVPVEGESPLDSLSRWPLWEQAEWVFARVLGAVVLTPVVEELAFRGYLFRRLGGAVADGQPAPWRWAPGTISAVVFGLAHPDHWVAGTAAGFAYAWVVSRRGRVADAVIAHSVTNLTLMTYVTLTGRWGDW